MLGFSPLLAGGQGVGLEYTSRSDAVMLRRAMRGRWGDISELMEKAKEAASDLMDCEDPRAKAAGARLVDSMVRIHQKDEHKLIDVNVSTQDAELSAIAADLGIDPSLIIDATVEAGGSVEGIAQRTCEDDRVRAGERH